MARSDAVSAYEAQRWGEASASLSDLPNPSPEDLELMSTAAYMVGNVPGMIDSLERAKPGVAAFAPDLSPDIIQLHSSRYRNPGQLQEGPTLIVGAGNSGVDIGLEVAGTVRHTSPAMLGPLYPSVSRSGSDATSGCPWSDGHWYVS